MFDTHGSVCYDYTVIGCTMRCFTKRNDSMCIVYIKTQDKSVFWLKRRFCKKSKEKPRKHLQNRGFYSKIVLAWLHDMRWSGRLLPVWQVISAEYVRFKTGRQEYRHVMSMKIPLGEVCKSVPWSKGRTMGEECQLVPEITLSAVLRHGREISAF